MDPPTVSGITLSSNDDNGPPKKKRKLIAPSGDHEEFAGFIAKWQRETLCRFIALKCEWDLDRLHEFAQLCGSCQHDEEALEWIKSFDPDGCCFSNKYFGRFRFLQKLYFDNVQITPTFFDIFASGDNGLIELAIDKCSFSEEMKVDFFEQLMSDKLNHNKVQTLNLFTCQSRENHSDLTRLFTEFLIRSAALKSLSMALTAPEPYRMNLALLAGAGNLECFGLTVKNAENLQEVVGDEFGLFSALKQCPKLNAIKVDMHRAIDGPAVQQLSDKLQGKDPDTTTAADMQVMRQSSRLVQMFRDLLHDLSVAFHENAKPFGDLTVEGMTTSVWRKTFEEMDSGVADAAEDRPKLHSLYLDSVDKDDIVDLQKFATENAKHIKITMLDTVMLTERFEDVLQRMGLTLDQHLNTTLESFGFAFFSLGCVSYKQFHDVWARDVIVVETINDENRAELTKCLPMYLGRSCKNEDGEGKEEGKSEEEEEEEESEDEDADLDADNEGDEQEPEDLSNASDQEQDEKQDLEQNKRLEALQKYDDEMIRETVTNLVLHDVGDPNAQYLSTVTNILDIIEKQMLTEKRLRQYQIEYDNLRMSKLAAEIKLKPRKPIQSILTHFSFIYEYIGGEEIKHGGLLLVNKELFALCFNKVYRPFAQYLYKFNRVEFNKKELSKILHFAVPMLKIDREDLYPLSLLRELVAFDVGMVEYCNYQRITTRDICDCFSNWRKLKSLNLWHYNDDAGSRYNGNPLNATLTNALLTASADTLQHVHLAMDDPSLLRSIYKWIPRDDGKGNTYYRYKHSKRCQENEGVCIDPDFSLLRQCALQHFSVYAHSANEAMLNELYEQVRNIVTIKQVTIQVAGGAWTAPDDDMTGTQFKTLVSKWKSVLVENGKNAKFYGTLKLLGIPKQWFEMLVKEEQKDWFWRENECNVDCLEISKPYFDVEWSVLSDLMELKKSLLVSNLCFDFIAPLHVDFRSYGKFALLRGFCTKRGQYRNQVIMKNITPNDFDDIKSNMLQYIEEIDENGKSNFENDVDIESMFATFDGADDDDDDDVESRNSDYYV